jgi:endonuclease/exonuclease/phosphatase family metal-dependent hydrolase
MVFNDPKFNPDVVVLQECANQSDLEYFNRRWLGGMYETIIQFPSNTTRDQHLAIMLKPGFKVVEQRTDYHKTPDSVPNDRGNLLFARGPSFVLIETPAGFKMWVGTTHQKSKGGNSVEVTQWRNREAVQTHKILRELRETGHPVMLLGDFNDEIGIQEFEQEGGGDVMANVVGTADDGLVLLTEPLSRAGKISFGGYNREDYRSFIDHVIATSDLKDRVENVDVYQDGVAKVASDHYPVFVRLKTKD